MPTSTSSVLYFSESILPNNVMTGLFTQDLKVTRPKCPCTCVHIVYLTLDQMCHLICMDFILHSC